MLEFAHALSRTCEGWTRRRMLQVAGIDLLGISLAETLRSQDLLAAQATPKRETSCIFIWLNGGPSHFETFDPKPKANDSVRGPYAAINTDVPGVQISELLPMLASRVSKYSVIRSMSHKNTSHGSTAMLTGFDNKSEAFGAVATKIKRADNAMPPYVHIGSTPGEGSKVSSNIDRVGGGSFGPAFNPIAVRDPSGKKVELPNFSLSADISADRFQQRQNLLKAVENARAELGESPAIGRMDAYYRKAIEMLTSTRVRDAFDLAKEKPTLRMQYGANFFGQACVMARRLVEAGTRYIQIKWYDVVAFDAWDCHGAELPGMMRMEQQLCPRLDQGLSALLDDLDDRGLLESTLVVVAGEFGRTPKINKSGARDHWPHCFSALMAGGGIPGGTIVGASDAKGAYPSRRPISPTEFAATIYNRLGIDTTGDLRIRPFINNALPVRELVGG
ncbi:MAG: DUF1501 domain-containing protein [Planctomycetaceae bacterium]|jgi:hypothetical protein|nr:DUF1501 domain-containing protein [Planctomycetaceae bacterium]MBT6494506.1 DUF1501 domain-containing protein [Planctomycetaceae bacterium]